MRIDELIDGFVDSEPEEVIGEEEAEEEEVEEEDEEVDEEEDEAATAAAAAANLAQLKADALARFAVIARSVHARWARRTKSTAIAASRTTSARASFPTNDELPFHAPSRWMRLWRHHARVGRGSARAASAASRTCA